MNDSTSYPSECTGFAAVRFGHLELHRNAASGLSSPQWVKLLRAGALGVRSVSQLLTIVLLLLLSACASDPGIRQAPALDLAPFLDASVFSDAHQNTMDFTVAPLPAEVVTALDERMDTISDSGVRLEQLVAFVESREHFEDANYTLDWRLAPQTDRRERHSLEAALLFARAARQLDLEASYQLVHVSPYFDYRFGYWMEHNYINVTGQVRVANPGASQGVRSQQEVLEEHRSGNFLPRTVRNNYTLGFNPELRRSPPFSRKLEDDYLAAHYFNNLAEQQMLENNMGGAFGYLRLALEADSLSIRAWNNLGIIYSEAGATRLAIAAFDQVAIMEPGAYTGKLNLMQMYRRLGDESQANAMERSVQGPLQSNPYYFYWLGNEKLATGDRYGAVTDFSTALTLDRNEHLFNFGLARARQLTGDYDAARDSLIAARRRAREPGQRTLYGYLLQDPSSLADMWDPPLVQEGQ